jgi:hypothetical protein
VGRLFDVRLERGRTSHLRIRTGKAQAVAIGAERRTVGAIEEVATVVELHGLAVGQRDPVEEELGLASL